ncbi:DUF7282 domain-containing protein [Halomicrobium salinisoli]|uniref:DUF7282 domain-containing protein n=1 Tax=Halomicrobium salinisoli TaxID=2878391 RepID=UPI001CF0CAC0|nr:hypothetical protein [Halomicrobium salinisoli]
MLLRTLAAAGAAALVLVLLVGAPGVGDVGLDPVGALGTGDAEADAVDATGVADAGIDSVTVINEEGDGVATASFDLRIVADTNCVGCYEEPDDDPNVNPFFKVFVVGEAGNEVELESTDEVENDEELAYEYAVDEAVLREFNRQTLEVRVELWDRDLLLHDRIDEQSISVDWPPDPETPATETATDTPTESTDGDRSAGMTFENQTSTGTSVVVQSASVPADGFVLLYDSALTTQLGRSDLVDGAETDVNVSLDRPISESRTLVAIAFEDADGDGQFERGTDEVYVVDGEPVVEAAVVAVETDEE